LVPQGFHLRARDLRQGSALGAREAFHFAKTAGKFGAGFLEGDFRIEVEKAGQVYGDEKEVTEFGFDGVIGPG